MKKSPVFGTDGIRGRAGEPPVDAPTARALGRALGAERARVLVARDTRPSGPSLQRALVEGVRAAGGQPVELGVFPTPGLSVVLAETGLEWGVMITASHNPPHDNGLKVLSSRGTKLDDATQQQVERDLARALEEPEPDAPPWAPPPDHEIDAPSLYRDALQRRLPHGPWLGGTTVVVDAAQGAASELLPQVVADCGARVVPLCCEARGDRINVDCGVMNPERLVRAVREHGARAGIALDGDGDRAHLVTASGAVVDGDAMLYLLARPPAVVGTVMTGMGLEHALGEQGIQLVRTSVGDRFVDAAVRSRDLHVGGEASGHICLSDGLPTADGVLAALRVLAGGLDLDARLSAYTPFPSRLTRVPAGARPELDTVPALRDARRHAQDQLGRSGRVLVRYSGTEPVLRILVEGADARRVEAVSQALTAAAAAALGAAGGNPSAGA